MRQFNLIRLALFQMGFGIMLGFLHDTLNRVMTSDLGIASTIVFGLISLKELLAVFGIKVWAGNMSDKSHLFGYKRSPYILLGIVSCVFSFMLSPVVAYEVKIAGVMLSDLTPAMILTDTGLLKLVVIFLVFGFGLQVATTAYYALLADYVGDKHIGKVTSASWTLMVLTTIISARVVGTYLDVYSPERLVNVAFVGGIIALGIALFAFAGVEERNAGSGKGKKEDVLSFGQSIKLLSTSPKTLLFAFYIFVAIFALFTCEIVMEPFGADVFGMPVGVTTKLFRPTMGGTQLVFMLLVGFLLNRIGKKRGALIGNLFGMAGFSIIIVAGFLWSADPATYSVNPDVDGKTVETKDNRVVTSSGMTVHYKYEADSGVLRGVTGGKTVFTLDVEKSGDYTFRIYEKMRMLGITGDASEKTVKEQQEPSGEKALVLDLSKTVMAMKEKGERMEIGEGRFTVDAQKTGVEEPFQSSVVGFFIDPILRIGLVIAGIGLGAASVSNITMMMTMTAGRSGVYIGLWGTAQSLAMFMGHFGAGVIRDKILEYTSDYMLAYATIFGLEIVAFGVASALLPLISKDDFEAESKVKIAEVLAKSGAD